MRLLTAAVVSLSALALTPAGALAAPPANDNYLASIPIDAQAETTCRPTRPRRARSPTSSTRAATVSRSAAVTRRRRPATASASARPSGTTSRRRSTTASSCARRASRPWSRSTSGTGPPRASRGSSAARPSVGEDLLLDLEGDKDYTIQVGGVAGAGGPLTLRMDAFPDTDGDGALDALDKCWTSPASTPPAAARRRCAGASRRASAGRPAPAGSGSPA